MSKKVAVMQPYLFPYIGYFQLINACDCFINFDDVKYIKKGWINKNYILSNSKPLLFSMPLEKASQNKSIREINICDDPNWKRKFLLTLQFSYEKAEYYKIIIKLIKDILNFENRNLSEFLLNSIKKISDYLSVSTEIIDSSSVFKNSDLKSEKRIIDICRQCEADEYINPIGGVELYSKQAFESEGIKLNFLKSGSITYRQFGNKFIENLSIIDILMLNNKRKIREFLNTYELS